MGICMKCGKMSEICPHSDCSTYGVCVNCCNRKYEMEKTETERFKDGKLSVKIKFPRNSYHGTKTAKIKNIMGFLRNSYEFVSEPKYVEVVKPKHKIVKVEVQAVKISS